jgi:proline iminopeptidase
MDYKALLLLSNTRQMRYFCDPDRAPVLPVWRPGAHVEYLRSVRMGAGPTGGRFEYDFVTGLERFSGPLVLVGTTCSALGEAFQRTHHLPLLPRAQLIAIEDAGHRVIVERPDRLLEIVRTEL